MNRTLAALIMLALCALPAQAQQRAAPQPQRAPVQVAPQTEQAPAPTEPLPPYNADLLKLSEAMGSIAFLRTLCIGMDEPLWREKMTQLIESEARTPARREALAGAYNQGYRAYALTYRACTDSAREALVRLAREGERLSRALATRFGG